MSGAGGTGLDGESLTPPTGMTEQGEPKAYWKILEAADQALGAAGATGARTATLSTSKRSAAGLVALKPAAAGAPTPTPTATPTATATTSSNCSGLSREAEAGTLSGAFVVGNDSAASGGSYIRSNTEYMQMQGNINTASYCFTVSQAGTYRIQGWVYADDAYSDSFFVTVDGQPAEGYLWDFYANTDYEADYVSQRYGDDPVEVELSAGQHTVTVYVREENARLDKLELEPVSGGSRSGGSPHLGNLPAWKTITAFFTRLFGQGQSGLPAASPAAQAQTSAKKLYAPPRLAKRGGNHLSKAYTLFLPPEGTVYTSYYYAGAQRVAKRETTSTGSAVYYLLGDHLGSTSVVTDSSGNKLAELRYKPWGGLRYNSGNPHTDFTFTGQRAMPEWGLQYYHARWFDSALGRWIQPDTIIPLGQGVQAFDRYAYVNNSPVVYNDPSGHCAIWMIVLGVALAADAAYMGANAMGWIPDYVGIVRAETVMGRNGGSIEVAAGLAVQGEYSGVVDNVVGDVFPGPSGYGLAQTNSVEISNLGLGNLDPQNPVDAAQVMEERISSAQGACNSCSPTDLLIVAALAQNRSITVGQIEEMSEGGGGINWENFLNAPITPSQPDAKIRQTLTGIPYDRRFMLLKYIQDLRVLYQKGWELPDGITEADLDNLEEIARTGKVQ